MKRSSWRKKNRTDTQTMKCYKNRYLCLLFTFSLLFTIVFGVFFAQHVCLSHGAFFHFFILEFAFLIVFVVAIRQFWHCLVSCRQSVWSCFIFGNLFSLNSDSIFIWANKIINDFKHHWDSHTTAIKRNGNALLFMLWSSFWLEKCSNVSR